MFNKQLFEHNKEGKKMKQMMKKWTLSVLLIWIIIFPLTFFLPLISVKADSNTASIVGTSTTNGAVSNLLHRKTFYANGYFWVFYSDGTNMVYSISIDGKNWAVPVAIRGATSGDQFSIWFNGTYLYYAYASKSQIYYRCGIPNSNGTITWLVAEQAISTTYNKAYYPCIATDSNGYVWIGYTDCTSTNNFYYPFVIRSGNNDGTWGTTQSGFPYQFSNVVSGWGVLPVPLTSGKMLVIYTRNGDVMHACLWNGSAWDTGTATTTIVQWDRDYSAVAQGDDVHLVFLKSGTYDIIYTKYIYALNSFGSEIILQTSAMSTSSPVISIDMATNDLYVFAATKTTGTPLGWTANHIYYIKYTNLSGIWGSWVDWIDETTEGLLDANKLTCSYNANNDKISLIYMTKTASPYNIKFALLTLNVPPNAPILNSPAANYRFNPNASVTFSWAFNDPDSGDSQSAYQFQIWDSGFATIYLDTGKVFSSSQSTAQTLPSNMTVGAYYWRVKTWDSRNTEGAWSSAQILVIDKIKVESITTNKLLRNPGSIAIINVTLRYAWDSNAVESGIFSLNGISMVHVNNGLWQALDMQNYVHNQTYDSVSGVEGIYGLTAIDMNGQSLTIEWNGNITYNNTAIIFNQLLNFDVFNAVVGLYQLTLGDLFFAAALFGIMFLSAIRFQSLSIPALLGVMCYAVFFNFMGNTSRLVVGISLALFAAYAIYQAYTHED